MPAKFKFTPAPKAGGNFTTRAPLGAQIDQTALTATVAAHAGITPAQTELAIAKLFDALLAAAEDNGWSDGLYERIRFRANSGGVKPAPGDFQTADEINADVSLSFLIAAIRDWRTRLSLENLGVVGKVTPLVATVLNMLNGRENEYTAGQNIKLIGHNLAFDPTDLAQGVFLKAGAAAEVRATVYGDIDPGSAVALVPTGTTGAVTVRVVAYINGSLRSYTYLTNLTASV